MRLVLAIKPGQPQPTSPILGVVLAGRAKAMRLQRHMLCDEASLAAERLEKVYGAE